MPDGGQNVQVTTQQAGIKITQSTMIVAIRR